jgi:hypothetical protein
MAKKRTSQGRSRKPKVKSSKPSTSPSSGPAQTVRARVAVTADRFTRLCRLLSLLADAPRTRDRLTRDLDLDVRGFYRDLELLRAAGIAITLHDGEYALSDALDTAVARLPFPDPHLTLGEARQLARGRSRSHQYLQSQIDEHAPE